MDSVWELMGINTSANGDPLGQVSHCPKSHFANIFIRQEAAYMTVNKSAARVGFFFQTILVYIKCVHGLQEVIKSNIISTNKGEQSVRADCVSMTCINIFIVACCGHLQKERGILEWIHQNCMSTIMTLDRHKD